MARFRDIKTLQKFGAVYASIHNHFNQDRQLNRRDIFTRISQVTDPLMRIVSDADIRISVLDHAEGRLDAEPGG